MRRVSYCTYPLSHLVTSTIFGGESYRKVKDVVRRQEQLATGPFLALNEHNHHIFEIFVYPVSIWSPYQF